MNTWIKSILICVSFKTKIPYVIINIAQVSFLPLLNDAIPNKLIGKNFRVIVNLTVNGGDSQGCKTTVVFFEVPHQFPDCSRRSQWPQSQD